MFEFTDAERLYLSEMRALGADEQGRDVLVGLTLEETAFYMEHSRRFTSGNRDRDPENRKRYLTLHEKHEKSRLQVLGAEIYVRTGNPARH